VIEDANLPMNLKPALARGCKLRDDNLQIPEGMIKMTATGLEIVKMCDGTVTVAEIVDDLIAKYASAEPAKIKAETLHFLKRLNERAVLIFQ
jgi:coenzyme PQQ biosynthesis protein PqqD